VEVDAAFDVGVVAYDADLRLTGLYFARLLSWCIIHQYALFQTPRLPQ